MLLYGCFVQAAPASVAGAPGEFLHRRFPNWKEKNEIYMIPPIFQIPYQMTNNGHLAAKYTIYNHLRHLGDVGMFVVYGFMLLNTRRFDRKCKSEGNFVPESMTEESDFIIFHHRLGIVLILAKDHFNVDSQIIEKAQHQLKASHDIIKKFAHYNFSDADDYMTIPCIKVIALPFMEKKDFYRQSDGMSFLFTDDIQDTLTFQKWWDKEIESRDTIRMSAKTQQAFERALSYVVMIRHMSPVINTERMNVRKNDKTITFNKAWKLVGKIDEGSLIEDAFSAILDDYFYIAVFFYRMIQLRQEILVEKNYQKEEALKKYTFLELASPGDILALNRHLAKSAFIEGGKPSAVDKQLYELLTRKRQLKIARHPRRPILMTSEQLVVFEGPKKQLIIGPPGSGRTELMKFKTLELNYIEMNSCTGGKKIMYILANASPYFPESISSLLYHLKQFFKDFRLVEVISIALEKESAEDTEQTASEIRKKIKSGEYGHAFIDEYWIGSKPDEHKIILELVRGLPGYVWISSAFDYRRDLINEDQKMIERTRPLLAVMREHGGAVRRITQVMRASNNIIELLREYSKLYENRSYPYGTEQILGHSYDGSPVTWTVEENVDRMYSKCVHIVTGAIADFSLKSADEKVVPLDPEDILVVDFAFRMEESRELKHSLFNRLKDSHKTIGVCTFNGSLEQFKKCETSNIMLLQSIGPGTSEFLDGVEWPMVVVILPSSMVLRTAKLVEGAGRLTNYEPFLSFSRSIMKLVVISDKWTNKEEFFSDVKIQL